MTRKSIFGFGAVLVGVVLASGCASSTDDGAASSSAVNSGSSSTEERTIATVHLTDWAAQMKAIAARDYDIAGVDLDAQEVDLVVTRSVTRDLRTEGFDVVRERSATVDDNGDEMRAVQYKAPSDIEAAVKGYAEQYPTIAAAHSLGKSNEGRDIWALQITKDVAQHAPKPVILFNGAHHAREVMSVEVPIDTIETLLFGYGTDPKVTHWVDANEIWVVPMLNVDGSNRVFTEDTLWRKNARGCPASGSCASHTGVDINRNYPYGWASCNGSSTSTRADDYHGPSAASEPETRAMMTLVQTIRPVFDISYHAYSEVVLYPYGCQGQHIPSRAIVEDIGGKMAAKLPTDDSPARNYKPGTPWELLYSADGGDIDWMYHEYAVVPFAIELNGTRQGFHPAFATWRDKTVTKARAAWQLLLDRLDGSAVRGIARAADGSILTGAQVDVAPVGSATVEQTRGVNPDGSFHVVVLPGTYHVTVSAPGHAPFTRDVTVAATRVDLDATLN